MRITFYSNFLNHHQLPFCKEMVSIIGKDFVFVAIEPIPKERLDMGYLDLNKEFEFVCRSYENKIEYDKAKKLADESEIVILGSAPNSFIDRRIMEGKITFKYSERFFKKGIYRRFIPRTRKKIKLGYIKYKEKNLYMLSASAYTSYDLDLCGFPDHKCLKWGYFPEVKKQDLINLFFKKESSKTKILWVGRLLGLKKTIHALQIAKKLKKESYDFVLDIIGSGKQEAKLKKNVLKNELNLYVNFLGSMSPEKVRENMEKANIFLFTSNFQEGWGAVLNEAMNSGCAVVASHAIGSVPFLLEDGENGLIYKYKDMNDLYNKVKYLLDNPEKQRDYGIKAYNTLDEMWNARVAAQRFVELSKKLLKGEPLSFYKEGPLSKAEIIKNNWI